MRLRTMLSAVCALVFVLCPQLLEAQTLTDVHISSGADLVQTQNMNNVRLVFDSGKITIPDGFSFSGRDNFFFDGSTAPQGRVCITGWPLQLIDCTNIKMERVCFSMQRPAGLDPAYYEPFWSSPRFLATTEGALYNITLRRCELRGHTDEIAFWGLWSSSTPKVIGSKVLIEDCIVGPSSKGLAPGRLKHNFGLMLDGMEDVKIRRCLFVGNNRRNPQVRGHNILIENCHMFGYGTMAVGAHVDTWMHVRNCIFQPNAQTPVGRPSPIKGVEGTVTAFGRLPLKCYIEGCYEIGTSKHQDPQVRWNCWGWGGLDDLDPTTGQPVEDTMEHWRGLPEWSSTATIDYANLGVGDSYTTTVLTAVGNGNFTWLSDPPAIPTADY